MPIIIGTIISLMVMAIGFFDSPHETYYSIVAQLLSAVVIFLTFGVNLFHDIRRQR